MAKPNMKHLQKAAKEVSGNLTSQEKIDSLNKAFEMFSQETTRLEIAYAALSEQFKDLNLELEETNLKLKNKVIELDIITSYLNSILNNISQGIIFIDLNGIVTTYNPAAEFILGIDKEKILFSNFWDSFKDDIFGFSMHEALATKKSPETTFTTFRSDLGIHYELEIDSTFVFQEDGEKNQRNLESVIPTQGMIVIIRDITDIRHLQTLANRSDRMQELGAMAAQVAHEIRNPLGGIKGFASLLQRDLKENPELQQMAGYIIEGTDNLNRLVTQVLNYARPIQPHMESTDLIGLIEEMKQHILADGSFDKQRVEITSETDLKQLLVYLDPQLFKSALLNLIVNAIQAMPEGGKMTLGVQEEQGNAIVKVSDTGIGIPKENIEKIFSPFFTTKPDGNGFGLAEVHKVVQAHDGVIDVVSTVGSGTTFSIKIPLKKKTKNR
jgi:PAS domain S-box-containing protein